VRLAASMCRLRAVSPARLLARLIQSITCVISSLLELVVDLPVSLLKFV
jgi:hypothetical protein